MLIHLMSQLMPLFPSLGPVSPTSSSQAVIVLNSHVLNIYTHAKRYDSCHLHSVPLQGRLASSVHLCCFFPSPYPLSLPEGA